MTILGVELLIILSYLIGIKVISGPTIKPLFSPTDLMGKRMITSDSCNTVLNLMGILEIVIMNRADVCKRQMESFEQKVNQYSSEAVKVCSDHASLLSLINQHSSRLSAQLKQLDLQMSIKKAKHVGEHNVEICVINRKIAMVKKFLDHFASCKQLLGKVNTEFERYAEADTTGLTEFIGVQRNEVDDVILCVHSAPLITSYSNISPDLFDAFFIRFGRLECVVVDLENLNSQMDDDQKVLSSLSSIVMHFQGEVVDVTNWEDFPKM